MQKEGELRMNFRKYILLIIGLHFALFQLCANDSIPYGLIEKQGNQLPSVKLLTEDSVEVDLLDLIDKPTIISFVYFHCPGLCVPLLEGIAEVIDRSDAEIGTDYKVITISIDPDDTPSMAKEKKKTLITEMETKSAISHWQFLTATTVQPIQKISEATGYYIQKNEEKVIHVAALLMITPSGKISQYLYGTFFMPMHWSMAIEEARQEKEVASRIKNLKYCYNFARESNPNVVIIARVFGGSILFLALGLFFYLLFFSQKRKDLSHGAK